MEHVTSTPPSTDSAHRSRTALADAGIALGALDGRYRASVAPLVEHLSEAALNRERVRVEVEWLAHLAAVGAVPGARGLTDDELARLRTLAQDFDADDVSELAEIERETVHDVKAVEYYLKRRMTGTSLADLTELVHFCCTSEDINNLSYALMVRGAVQQVWLPAAEPARRPGRLPGDRAARRPDAGPHARPARDPDHARQGARRPGSPAAAPAQPDRAHRVPRQDQRRDGHVRRAPGRRAVDRLGRGVPHLRRSTSG